MRSLVYFSLSSRAGAARPLQAPRRALTGSLVVAALALAAAPAHALSPMLQGWLAVNTQCKGGPPDDPKTTKACARRDDLGAKLKRRGCEYQEDGDWWKCPH